VQRYTTELSQFLVPNLFGTIKRKLLGEAQKWNAFKFCDVTVTLYGAKYWNLTKQQINILE
jgi:hypothetical protein